MVSPNPVDITSGPPRPEAVLGRLSTEECGAVVLVATLARGAGLEVRLNPEGRKRLESAAQSVVGGRVRSAALSHADGIVPPGKPMAVAAVAAASRDDAFEAARRLLDGLKGVATRRDL